MEPACSTYRLLAMRLSQSVVAALAIVSLSTLSACGSEPAEFGAAPAAELAPGDCSLESGTGVDLDIPGPGTPTPEEAVAPYLNAYVIADVEEEQTSATVTAEAPGGATRVFDLTLRDDGWWPDSYVECRS